MGDERRSNHYTFETSDARYIFSYATNNFNSIYHVIEKTTKTVFKMYEIILTRKVLCEQLKNKLFIKFNTTDVALILCFNDLPQL